MKKMLFVISFCALLTGCKSQDSLREAEEDVKMEVITVTGVETDADGELVGKEEKSLEVETINEGRFLSFELNKEEQEREKLCRPMIAEYEMNIILELLDIQSWQAPPYAFDEMDLPTDEPLGNYSLEKLESYLVEQKEIDVEIFYYFGGHLSWRPEDKFPLQIIKINEQGEQIRFAYVMWSWWGDGVMSRDYFKLDKLEREREENEDEREARVKRQNLPESNNYKKVDYIGGVVLGLDNLEEVIEKFVTIKNEKELYKLNELPLTQSFYNQCVEDFPYVVNSEGIKRFWFNFYGLGEDNKMICLYTLSPYNDDMSRHYDEHYIYSIEMELQDGQIDSMDMTLLQHYLPE